MRGTSFHHSQRPLRLRNHRGDPRWLYETAAEPMPYPPPLTPPPPSLTPPLPSRTTRQQGGGMTEEAESEKRWRSWWKKMRPPSPLPALAEESCVVVRNLTQRFMGRRVLQKLTFTVPPGTIYGLVGHNGAGKSVTIHILAGYLRPTSGQVLLMGKPFSAWQNSPVGVVGESPIVLPGRTAVEHLEWVQRGADRPLRRDAIRGWLEKVAIDPDHPHPVRSFSLGMRKRLSLAQALLQDPPILLLDEPLAGLDDSMQDTMIRLLQEQADQGKAILWTSSEIAPCRRVCDCIGVLVGGRLRMEGPPSELMSHGPLYVNITTAPLPYKQVQDLRQQMLPHVATELTVEQNQLVAYVEGEQNIPMLLGALQQAAIPVYELRTSQPLESLFLS